jgi:hypothetical protein
MKKQVRTVLATRPALSIRRRLFPGSERYWESRYAKGGNSGTGSYGAEAEWKAEVVNGWVRELGISSVVDWGCGDGNQLGLAEYPRYLGIDRSPTAVRMCIERFATDPTKSFLSYESGALWDPAGWLMADAALSMEVIFHLTEEDVYRAYMQQLFSSAERFVIICSNDEDGTERGPTERHWRYSEWISENAGDWHLERVAAPPAGIRLMSKIALYRRVETF